MSESLVHLGKAIEALRQNPPDTKNAGQSIALAVTALATRPDHHEKLLKIKSRLKGVFVDAPSVIHDLEMIRDQIALDQRGPGIMLPTDIFDQQTQPSPPPRPPDCTPPPVQEVEVEYVDTTHGGHTARQPWRVSALIMLLAVASALLCFFLSLERGEEGLRLDFWSSITVENHASEPEPEPAPAPTVEEVDTEPADTGEVLRLQVMGSDKVMEVRPLGEEVDESDLDTDSDSNPSPDTDPDSDSNSIMRVRVIEGEDVGEIRHLVPVNPE